VYFQFAAYAESGFCAEFSNRKSGTITVKAKGETIVTCVNEDIGTVKKVGGAWNDVTVAETSEKALKAIPLKMGDTYTITNLTEYSYNILGTGVICNYANYRADGLVANYGIDSERALGISAYYKSVITVVAGENDLYVPFRVGKGLEVSAGGDGLIVKTLKAESTHVATNEANVYCRIKVSAASKNSEYTVNMYNDKGEFVEKHVLRGKELPIFSRGKTEIIIGKEDAVFYYPSGAGILIE